MRDARQVPIAIVIQDAEVIDCPAFVIGILGECFTVFTLISIPSGAVNRDKFAVYAGKWNFLHKFTSSKQD